MAEIMTVVHHSSVSASKAYQRLDAVSESNRLRCFGMVAPAVPAVRAHSSSTSSAQAAPSVPAVCTSSTCASSSPSNSMVDFDEWGDPLDDGTDFVLARKSSSSL